MRILDTILRLLPYQRAMLETDIPAEAKLEWCRSPRRGIRLVQSRPSPGNTARGFSSHIVEDNPIIIDMLDYVPGGDYSLTYEQALDQTRQGSMVQCSFGKVMYQYEADADCITCIDMEQPSDAERCCGWRIVPREEVQ